VEGYSLTGQSPRRPVVPMEEEEFYMLDYDYIPCDMVL
jgi:hypothetical protein